MPSARSEEVLLKQCIAETVNPDTRSKLELTQNEVKMEVSVDVTEEHNVLRLTPNISPSASPHWSFCSTHYLRASAIMQASWVHLLMVSKKSLCNLLS